MTAQEAINYFAADDETIKTVTDWLVKAGVPHKDIVLDKTRTVIHVESTVQKMEKVLQTRYHLYQSKITGRDHIGVDDYRLPKDIAAFVDFVFPAVSLGQVQRRDGIAPIKGAADNWAVKEPIRALEQDMIDKLASNRKFSNRKYVPVAANGGQHYRIGNRL